VDGKVSEEIASEPKIQIHTTKERGKKKEKGKGREGQEPREGYKENMSGEGEGGELPDPPLLTKTPSCSQGKRTRTAKGKKNVGSGAGTTREGLGSHKQPLNEQTKKTEKARGVLVDFKKNEKISGNSKS